MLKIFIKVTVIIILSVIFILIARPKAAIVMHNFGNDCYELGRDKEALEYFKKAAWINPSFADTHYAMGNTYERMGLKGQAIEEYKKAISLKGDYASAYIALSDTYLQQNMYQDALGLLSEAQKSLPADKLISDSLEKASLEYMGDCINKGTDAFLAGDKQKAYELVNSAIKIKPNFALSYYILANFYYTDNNLDQVQALLSEAIRLNPNFAMAYKLSGDAYFKAANYLNAIESYKKAAAINPLDAALRNDLGLAFMQVERFDEALGHLKEAQRLDPDNINITYSLASVYRDSGKPDDALSEYKKMNDLKSDYPNLHNDLADIYKQKGFAGEAKREYITEIENSRIKLIGNTNDPVILNSMAYAYNGAGEFDKAIEAIEKAISIMPDYREAYITQSKIYENMGKADDAIAVLNKAKSLSSENSAFIENDISRIKKEFQP